MLKRVAVMLLCLMMVFIATFGFVVGVVAVPTIYSYAEVIDDDPIYVPLRDPSDLVTSFQSYCKSRDLTIEGSIADAVTTFTTGTFNSACNTIGINIPQLQAEIKAEYDQAGKVTKFMYSATGIDAMNRIFAQFLQDNELEVGDEDVDKRVYSGYSFEDQNGNNCLVYIVSDSISESVDLFNADTMVLQYGSDYLYTNQYLYDSNLTSINLPILNSNYTNTLRLNRSNYSDTRSLGIRFSSSAPSGSEIIVSSSNSMPPNFTGSLIIYKRSSSNTYHLGSYFKAFYFNYNTIRNLGSIYLDDLTPQTVNINIVSNTINNNTYEGDTYITNEGDVIVEPDPVPPGGTDPGWDIGGGDGTATDGDGNTWNIQFPDFQLPDLNIDWSINGLGEKFPFSIPFDLVALVTVLNAEPQAPRFEGTVNFGFTTWNYDINLQQFDSVAQACRIAELLLLVVGLILVTRSIIKG